MLKTRSIDHAGPDAALLAACGDLGRAESTFSTIADAMLDPLPADLRRLLKARDEAAIAVAGMTAETDGGRRAKAKALLASIERLDPLPELELARSLAHDVLGGAA
jgi:hypothetical protein